MKAIDNFQPKEKPNTVELKTVHGDKAETPEFS